MTAAADPRAPHGQQCKRTSEEQRSNATVGEIVLPGVCGCAQGPEKYVPHRRQRQRVAHLRDAERFIKNQAFERQLRVIGRGNRQRQRRGHDRPRPAAHQGPPSHGEDGDHDRAVDHDMARVGVGQYQSRDDAEENALAGGVAAIRLQKTPAEQEQPGRTRPDQVMRGPEIDQQVVLGRRRQEKREDARGLDECAEAKRARQLPHANRADDGMGQIKQPRPRHGGHDDKERRQGMQVKIGYEGAGNPEAERGIPPPPRSLDK